MDFYRKEHKTMTRFSLLAVAALSLGMTGQASALTVTNYDMTKHTMKVTMSDGTTKQVTIETDETLTDVCPDGCTITLPNGQKGTYEGNESIFIEEGELFISE